MKRHRSRITIVVPLADGSRHECHSLDEAYRFLDENASIVAPVSDDWPFFDPRRNEPREGRRA